jgi:hypothetical protein
MTRLDDIRQREADATFGPWQWDDPYRLGQPGEDGMVVTLIDRFESKPDKQDRDFIAHARQDIPALLAALSDTVDGHWPRIGQDQSDSTWLYCDCGWDQTTHKNEWDDHMMSAALVAMDADQ